MPGVDTAGDQHLSREAGGKIRRVRAVAAIGTAVAMGPLAGCVTPSIDAGFPAQEALVGKTESEVIACAGKPKTKSANGEETRLTYHRSAPVFEESFVISKASVPCPRHACEAVVVLKGDRESEVGYNPVPHSLGGCEHCEEIFQKCLP